MCCLGCLAEANTNSILWLSATESIPGIAVAIIPVRAIRRGSGTPTVSVAVTANGCVAILMLAPRRTGSRI